MPATARQQRRDAGAGNTWNGNESSKPENQKETARVMRRLVTAGFSTGVIFKILRQWDVPEEALVALDNLDEDARKNRRACAV